MSKLCCSTDNNLNLVKKKEHKHKYDTQGNQLCCVRTEKIYEKAGAADLLKDANHKDDGHGHTDGSSCSEDDAGHCDDEEDHHDHSHHHHDHVRQLRKRTTA